MTPAKPLIECLKSSSKFSLKTIRNFNYENLHPKVLQYVVLVFLKEREKLPIKEETSLKARVDSFK